MFTVYQKTKSAELTNDEKHEVLAILKGELPKIEALVTDDSCTEEVFIATLSTSFDNTIDRVLRRMLSEDLKGAMDVLFDAKKDQALETHLNNIFDHPFSHDTVNELPAIIEGFYTRTIERVKALKKIYNKVEGTHTLLSQVASNE